MQGVPKISVKNSKPAYTPIFPEPFRQTMANVAQIVFRDKAAMLLPDDTVGALQITVGGGRTPLSADRAAGKIRQMVDCDAHMCHFVETAPVKK